MRIGYDDYEDINKFEDFQLGEDERCRISTDAFKTQLNNNILVVGGTGSGKTISVANPMFLHLENSNAVGIFTKRGIIDDLKEVLEHKGYTVYLMDFVETYDAESYGFDPIQYCRNMNDIKMLARAIIRYNPAQENSSRDKYWETTAESVIIPFLKYIRKGRYFGKKSLISFIELMDTLNWSVLNNEYDDDEDFDYDVDDEKKEVPELVKVIRHIKKTDKLGFTNIKAFIDLPDATGACVTSEIQTSIQDIFQPSVRKIIRNQKQFDFSNLLNPKTVLFVRMSPVDMAQHRFIGIFYQFLFKKLFEYAERRPSRILPSPVHVICDDFATGTHIPDFANLISIFREKRISVTMLLQSESQLAGMYGPNDATTIINNCDTYVYLGGMDINTSRNISARMNCPLEDVLNMPVGQEFFFRRGQKPLQTKRYDLFNDSIYKKMKNGDFKKNREA